MMCALKYFLTYFQAKNINYHYVHKLSLQFSKFVKILLFEIFSFDLFYSEENISSFFFLNRYLWK